MLPTPGLQLDVTDQICSREQELAQSTPSQSRPIYEDPPLPLQLGRPRTARLVASREGRGKQGGGGGQGYRKPAAMTIAPEPTLDDQSPFIASTIPSSILRPVRRVLEQDPLVDARLTQLNTHHATSSSARIDTMSQGLNATLLGPVRRQRNCGLCGQPGHNRTTCGRQPGPPSGRS